MLVVRTVSKALTVEATAMTELTVTTIAPVTSTTPTQRPTVPGTITGPELSTLTISIGFEVSIRAKFSEKNVSEWRTEFYDSLFESFRNVTGFKNVTINKITDGSVNCDYDILVEGDSDIEAVSNDIRNVSMREIKVGVHPVNTSKIEETITAFKDKFTGGEGVCEYMHDLLYCNVGYECKIVEGKVECTPLCSEHRCGKGTCAFDQVSLKPTCKCHEDSSYIYSGERCNEKTKKLKLTFTEIIGIVVGVDSGLIIIFIIYIILIYVKHRREKSSYRSIHITRQVEAEELTAYDIERRLAQGDQYVYTDERRKEVLPRDMTLDLSAKIHKESTLSDVHLSSPPGSPVEHKVCQQNKMIKERSAKIHKESTLSDVHLSTPPGSPAEHKVLPRDMTLDLSAKIHKESTLSDEHLSSPPGSPVEHKVLPRDMTLDLSAKIHKESTLSDVHLSTPSGSPAEHKVCQQNKMLKERSAKIHKESTLSDVHLSTPSGSPAEHKVCQQNKMLKERSTKGEQYSRRSRKDNILQNFQTKRRSKLPVPELDKGAGSFISVIRNVGKGLTKSVTLNEPLSVLQRLCEELEYSDLIDKANEFDDPCERMIYIAAFAVSSYASSCYRVGHKPFNPVLGETYENIREDRGWRFVSEQVSHHPPISACYCDSENFRLWLNVQINTKVSGNSMEIQPIGVVNVCLPKYKDHYRWNKVTTCVHNILRGQRWVDHFGKMTVSNGNIVCELTFTEANDNQSDERHKVYGKILNSEGKVVHNLFGRWNEALYCGQAPSARCIWRPGTMPGDHERYYGFSIFAMELNEKLPDETLLYPRTDSRLRPDQRLLEEGKIKEAEAEKSRIKRLQQDRRKKREATNEDYRPKWFKKETVAGNDVYTYDNKYWECRKDPGFSKMTLPKIW